MGISIFIRPIENVDDLKRAFFDVFCHNCEKRVYSGEQYTLDEMEVLDPMRARVLKSFPFPPTRAGIMEKWNRGEDIVLDAILVKFQNKLWIEMRNQGGGVCTSLYLKNLDPRWIGTEGKPEGFYEAPSVFQGSFLDVLEFYKQHHAQ